MWVRVLEVWLTNTLLRSPAFHRAVQAVHRRVEQMRHGKPPEELGGTNIDHPGQKSVYEHFTDEIKQQLRGGPKK